MTEKELERERKIETQRLVTEVETIIEYQCVNCGQWFEGESQVGSLYLNHNDCRHEPVGNLCDGCIRAVFGVDTDLTHAEKVKRAVGNVEGWRVLTHAIERFPGELFRLAMPIIVVAVITSVAFTIIDEMTTSIAENAELIRPEMGAPLDFLPLVLVGFFIVLFLSVIDF